MKFILIALVLLCIFITSAVYAQQPSSNSIIGESGLIFELESAQSITQIDSYSPDHGKFFVLLGTLSNPTNSSLCPYAREVILTIDGTEYLPIDSAMAAFQKHLNPFRDYIGSVIGQCVNRGDSEKTFVVYDTPAVFTHATLSFQDVSLNITFHDMTLTPSPSQTIIPSQTYTPTSTLTFTPSITLTSTLTFTSSITSSPTLTITPSATPSPTPTPIPGLVVSNGTNARGCPSISCNVVHVINILDNFVVVGVDFGWYLVELPTGERVYVRSDLVRVPAGVEVPNAPTLSPSLAPTVTVRPTNTLLVPTKIRATPTEVPFVIGDEDVLVLIQANMQIEGYEVDAIKNQNGNLIVDAPAVAPDFTDETEYRIGYLGYLVGSVVAAYRGENVNASPPSNIVVQFKFNHVTLVRITVSYRDAVSFIDGNLTAVQFFSQWTVE